DYAWEVFRKADRLRPGAFAVLAGKALQLTGGPNAPAAPPRRTNYGTLVAEGKADIFLNYSRACGCRSLRGPRAKRQLTAGLPACHVYLVGPRPARVGKVWLRCAGAVAIGSFKKGAFQGSLLTSQRLYCSRQPMEAIADGGRRNAWRRPYKPIFERS